MQLQKITPTIWLSAHEGSLSPIIAYYKKAFGEHFVSDTIQIIGDTPSGHTELCLVSLYNFTFHLMCTKVPHHVPNDAFSLTVQCEDRNEIDAYWDYFTKEGKPSQCGWCEDVYGLRWQIVPKNLSELLQKPNGWQIMMNQTKIVINEYKS